MRVRELMSESVTKINASATLKQAARLMTDMGISGLPVVDDVGRLIGVISEADFVAHTSDRGRAGLLRAFFDGLRSKGFDNTVGDVMSRKLITIAPFESHTAAARLMQRHKVKRLPVVNDEGKVLGVVSRADILAVFARPDEDIEEEIRNRLIGQILRMDVDQMTLDVSEGRVTIGGTTPTSSEAHLLETLIQDLAGVISVTSHLGYVVDDTQQSREPLPYGVPRRNW